MTADVNRKDAVSTRWRKLDTQRRVLAGAAAIIAAGLLLWLTPAIHQPQAYHAFHDTRAFAGIPNFLNVISNLPFVVIGALALRWLGRAGVTLDAPIRRAWIAMFAGILLTGFGSAYYHWAPSDATLLWDRLPIAVAATGLLAAVIGERVGVLAGRRVLWPLLAFGIVSVFVWAWTGDLRLYLLVQFVPIIAIPVMLVRCPARFSRGGDIWLALGLYVVAKLLEEGDGRLLALGHIVSGHTLKHVAAAAASFAIYRMLRLRQEMSTSARH